VASAAGIPVAKHGNRAMSGVCGSADVLEALGVRVTLTAEECAACIDTVGIAFLFAPQHHPAMKQVGGPRREIGIRTLFNLVGPLTNPAGASRQVMGVYAPELCPLAASALNELGSERALVLHGEIGLDEISPLGPTRFCELRDGSITDYLLSPHDLGLEGPKPEAEHLAPAATPEANAALVREVLAGKPGNVAARARMELVAVNAAAALRIFGVVEDWRDAVALARTLLESGKALTVLENLIDYTQSLPGR
jgi:anthranilate phosphoribosyltransferase